MVVKQIRVNRGRILRDQFERCREIITRSLGTKHNEQNGLCRERFNIKNVIIELIVCLKCRGTHPKFYYLFA